MTELDLKPPPAFKAFWKRWKGPVEGRLANANEGKHEAEVVWKRLSAKDQRLAHEWGPHFQKEFRKANGTDCSMLHCCRYLSKKRFLNYEDEEPQNVTLVLKDTDPGYAAWVEHMRLHHENSQAYTLYIKGGMFHNKLRAPTPFPPEEKT